jgi:asparagine synthase (glutamine-hydrolysing)
MCGIAGYLNPAEAVEVSVLNAMANTLGHRGPDDSGVWVDQERIVGLAHRRLSIIDLSSAGHQPMHSHDGKLVLIFNGEIYNHLEIRKALVCEGNESVWNGRSDTETLLAAISAWGIENTLTRARGMFCLGLWNKERRSLTLARDRMGEKPLYYGRLGDAFAFASELKALRAVPSASFHTDPDAVALLLRYGYVPTPLSIYRGIYKLPPGSVLEVSADGNFGSPTSFWNLRDTLREAEAGRCVLRPEEAVDELAKLLGAAVCEQMVSDVPLGALLSGGIDSSLVVALMQAHSTRKVRTFSIGFSESEYDEAKYAARVAEHLGTEHTELRVNAQQALDIIPRLPEIYDEPFADPSQIPTALVCALTRKHVKVCLSGDAGDELFAGYNRYLWAPSLWSRFGKLPVALRSSMAAAVSAIPASTYNRLAALLQPVTPSRWGVSNPGDKLHKLAGVLAAPTRQALYLDLVSQWRGRLPLLDAQEPATLVSDANRWPKVTNFNEQMMAVDSLTYLPDDILVKVDRAAMAVSLENRVPFLDQRVVGFAWSLPLDLKIREGRGKWIVRQLLQRYVPSALVERPKQGFAAPIEHWLRGPLRDWAENLLSNKSLSDDGLLDPKPIRQMWALHLGGRNVQYALWSVLMYLAWRRHWCSSSI